MCPAFGAPFPGCIGRYGPVQTLVLYAFLLFLYSLVQPGSTSGARETGQRNRPEYQGHEGKAAGVPGARNSKIFLSFFHRVKANGPRTFGEEASFRLPRCAPLYPRSPSYHLHDFRNPVFKNRASRQGQGLYSGLVSGPRAPFLGCTGGHGPVPTLVLLTFFFLLISIHRVKASSRQGQGLLPGLVSGPRAPFLGCTGGYGPVQTLVLYAFLFHLYSLLL